MNRLSQKDYKVINNFIYVDFKELKRKGRKSYEGIVVCTTYISIYICAIHPQVTQEKDRKDCNNVDLQSSKIVIFKDIHNERKDVFIKL